AREARVGTSPPSLVAIGSSRAAHATQGGWSSPAERVASLARERAARAEAERERDFAQLVLGSAPVGIGVLEGPEHRVRLVNRCTVELSGTAAEKLLGRSIEELVPDVAHVVRPVVDRVYASGRQEVLRDVAVPLRNGTTVHADVTYAPLPGPDGLPAGVIYLAQGVSERKRAEADPPGAPPVAGGGRAAGGLAERAHGGRPGPAAPR